MAKLPDILGLTGLTKEEYTRNFQRAEQHYKSAGYQVVNPVKLGEQILALHPEATYEDFMLRDLEALATCTAIALISGWEQSPGAQREKAEAERLGLEIMQYKETDKMRKASNAERRAEHASHFQESKGEIKFLDRYSNK